MHGKAYFNLLSYTEVPCELIEDENTLVSLGRTKLLGAVS
jgi:hypothetical protein